MSHFSVAVFSDGTKTIEELMQPYHEFESDGVDDEFVKDVNFMDNARKDYEKHSDNRKLRAFVHDWYGLAAIFLDDKPDINNEHKYGWFRINGNGDVTEVIRRTNPDDKWDWWVVGGRWSGLLASKNGSKIDEGKIKDIKPESLNQLGTFAVITPDGKWHEKGKMGWFGASSATEDDETQWRSKYKEVFVDTADPDWTLTIVDCHI